LNTQPTKKGALCAFAGKLGNGGNPNSNSRLLVENRANDFKIVNEKSVYIKFCRFILFATKKNMPEQFPHSNYRGIRSCPGTGKTEASGELALAFLDRYPDGRIVFITPRVTLVENEALPLKTTGAV
jgi:hypothetical protein